jgi:branched-chain amino acid transport system ATP-binding protein
MTMLEVRDLGVTYGMHKALEGAALTVSPGEIVVILGANGAGKSTLLKALSGICEGQVQGAVTLGGQSLDGLGPDRIVEEGIALVPESRGIFGDLTVEENLKLGAFPNRARGEEQANLDRVFALFPKLTERRRQIARTMSGGEQQMVAIGRAMMSSPRILALDEPSLGLSPLLCKELFQNLAVIKDLGIGVLMVEQNAKQSLAIADRGYLLENTRIVHEDRAEALRNDPAVQAAYLGAGSSAARSAPQATPAHHAKTAQIAAPAQQATEQDVPKITPSVPRRTHDSADALAMVNISDLLAKADQTAKAAAPAKPVQMADTQERSGEIQAMLKEFEIAAARAGHTKPLPDYRPELRPELRPKHRDMPSATPATAAPAQAETNDTPVTIEVYRAPRVDVYRRRPSGDFERD